MSGEGTLSKASQLMALAEKVRARIMVSPTGCWEWPGAHNPKGYGQVWDALHKKKRATHRVMFTFSRGEIPAGLHIDHLCRNPKCCNPDHLEAVTPQENTRRGDAGVHAKKLAQTLTTCVAGHEINDANTYTRRDGRRQCRTCKMIRDATVRAGRRQRGLTQAGKPRKRLLSPNALTPAELMERYHAK